MPSAGAHKHALPEVARARLERLAQLLADAPLNLVSRGDRSRLHELHIPEAEAVARALALQQGAVCLDLGSGGGLPGLVIAIVRPDVTVTCLDARAKKMAHVGLMVEQLELDNVAVEAGRAESKAREEALRGRFTDVVSRAVGSANVVAELARGFLGHGGRLAVVKGPGYQAELPAAAAAARQLGFGPPRAREVPGAPRPTWLVEFVAVGAPAAWIPRRDGVPQNDPLGEGSS